MKRLLLQFASLLLAVATLAGCAGGGMRNAYMPGMDRSLTAQGYKAAGGNKAVVIVGSNRGLTWGPNIQANPTFETLPRLGPSSTPGYDVILIEPGTYVLESFLDASRQQADLYSMAGDVLTSTGRGAAAAFSVNPGDVVYIGDLFVQVIQNGEFSCEAVFELKINQDTAIALFQQKFPFVKKTPNVQPLTLMRPHVPYGGQRCL